MVAARRTLFILAVMLLAPLASAVDSPQSPGNNILQNAASNWHSMEPIDSFQSPLKNVDYQIHLAVGSFDPMTDELPKSRLDDSQDYRQTGMAIVQLNHHTGSSLYNLVDEYGVFILDNLGGSSWLVRLSHPNDLSIIQQDDSVRWAGSMMPGWRISPDVTSATSYIAAIPAVDLKPESLAELSHDLVIMGADEAWCGLHLCEIKGSINLESLARDGRIIWAEPAYEMKLTNAVAGAIVGVSEITNSSLGLDGSGEKISFTDTGIDQTHPDIIGRIAGVYTQFGLDPSPADSNGGHGTHVALTIAGDGSGDSSATGIAPAANIVVYALEHDPTGVFGRIGSIYDMLSHAEQEGSRVAVNAWGSNGNYGAYTADSRSLDVFVHDNPDFLPIFSAGDDPAQNASKVLAPSTAKNVLSIGASTTNPAGSVANFSSQGPSLDGRVKPDLVAPGISLCSGRGKDASIPIGLSCGTGTHSNGENLYMSLSGSSQATAVAGGSISLIREFIREEVGIATPTASLLKAASINGAIDLGTANIPNAQEGWGQISVANTVIPSYNGNDLDTYHDNLRTLSAGFSTLYQFDINPSSGLDITLVWSDVAGSANSAQNESRLVNDLDLLLTAPDGTVYKGNVIVNGYSVPNGVHDSINNVERINLEPSSALPSGKWQVEISHTGGLDQAYSLILTGDATLDEKADLMVFDGSIFPSSTSPLVDDYITIRTSWFNQGTADASQFRVTLEDLTEGTTLFDGQHSSHNSGIMESLTIPHIFTSTGDHNMRLTVDVDSDIVEVNDESNGINNNVEEMTITVAALGVRLVTLDSNGLEDSSMVNQTLNVTAAEGFTWPIILKHEGTETQSIKLHLSQVQMPNPLRPDMLLPPDDDWSRYSDLAGPFTLSGMGDGGDSIHLNITMNNEDADLSGSTNRYAMSGTYVMDLTAKYSNNPSVKHTIRLRLVVDDVRDVQVAAAGTSGLEAVPGASTAFSISVRNTGNSPALYDLDCYSQNRWQVQLGQSNSSSYSFEPLDILEYLPMQVRLYVPPVANGIPAAGSSDTITCSVTSELDPTLNISETVTLTVKALESFATNLIDDTGLGVGPAAYARSINVDTGERLNVTLEIDNTGNADLDLTVRINPELTTWTIQVTHESQVQSREVEVSIQPGESAEIQFEVLVSPVAVRNDENHLVIKTSQDQSNFIINETTLVVKDEVGLNFLTSEDYSLTTNVNGEFTYTSVSIENSGNSGINLVWSNSLAPDGWEIGFADPPSYLDPRGEDEVVIMIKAPANEPASDSAFELGIYVTIDNGFETLQVAATYPVIVQSGAYCEIEYDENTRPLLGIVRGDSNSQKVMVHNIGNMPLDANLSTQLDAADWDITLSEDAISGLAVGASKEIEITVESNDNTDAGIETLQFTCGSNLVELEVSVQNSQAQGGLFGILPMWAASSIIGVVLLIGVIFARRIKNSAPKDNSGEELVAPDAHSIPDDGLRMQAVMDSVVGQDSLASGGVSAEEIADALAKSIPGLPIPGTPPVVPLGRPPSALSAEMSTVVVPQGRPPAKTSTNMTYNLTQNIHDSIVSDTSLGAQPSSLPPPLPPTGLPPGWSMEQWQHYGHQWLAQQSQQ